MRYETFTNGGIPVARGPCGEATLVLTPDTITAIVAGAAPCSVGDVVQPGAAGAYWRIGESRLAGPVLANPVSLKVLALSSGEQRRGITSSETQRGLYQRESASGIVAGEHHRELTSAESSTPLVGSEQVRQGLTAGESGRALSSGSQQQAEAAPKARQALATDELSRPAIELRKSASAESLTPDTVVRFALDVKNVGATPVSYVFVFDRVPARLSVRRTTGRAIVLPDGSTLITWESRAPLVPGGTSSFTLEGQLR